MKNPLWIMIIFNILIIVAIALLLIKFLVLGILLIIVPFFGFFIYLVLKDLIYGRD